MLTEEDLQERRLKSCVAKWEDCASGEFNSGCCRFPKSCSPHGYIEAVRAGNLTEDDLEPRPGLLRGGVFFRTEAELEDVVNHPNHYTAYKGLEVIDLTEQMNFNRGNAVKYICRAGLKDPEKTVEDLEKAAWYIKREIKRLEGSNV